MTTSPKSADAVKNSGQTPEQVLEWVPGFAGAHIESQIVNGLTQDSFLVLHQGRPYVLRIDKPMAADLGLDRGSEFAIHCAAAQAGLAPKAVFMSVDKGVFIREFVPGRSWQGADLEDPFHLQDLAELLSGLHALPCIGSLYDPLRAIHRYATMLGSAAYSVMTDRAEKLINEIDSMSPPASPCHNDLLAQNILQAKGLLLIDWEFAGIGDPLFDLAVIIEHHHLSLQAKLMLLSAYLGREPLPSEIERLSLQQSVYGILLELWEAATQNVY